MTPSSQPIPSKGQQASQGDVIKPRRSKPNLWLPLSPFPKLDEGASESGRVTPALSFSSPGEKSVFDDWDEDEERSPIVFGEDTIQTLLVTPDTPYFPLPESACKPNRRLGITQPMPVSAVTTPHTPFFRNEDSDGLNGDYTEDYLTPTPASIPANSEITPVPANFRRPPLLIDTQLQSEKPKNILEQTFTLSALFLSPDQPSSIDAPFHNVGAPEVVIRN